MRRSVVVFFFCFQAEDGIRDFHVTGVQTCALPIYELIAYSKCTEDRSNVVLTVVNLNPRMTQEGWLELDLDALGVDPDQNFQVHDMLTDARHVWQGSRNFVRLDPSVVPAHMFRIRGRVRTEHDFESFM